MSDLLPRGPMCEDAGLAVRKIPTRRIITQSQSFISAIAP